MWPFKKDYPNKGVVLYTIKRRVIDSTAGWAPEIRYTVTVIVDGKKRKVFHQNDRHMTVPQFQRLVERAVDSGKVYKEIVSDPDFCLHPKFMKTFGVNYL